MDQPNGDIYAFETECSKKINYNLIKYDKEDKQFQVSTKELNLEKFYDKYAKNETVVTLQKSVICNNTVYQVINVGEEQSKSYLAEISILERGSQLKFKDAYPIDIKADESITYDVPVIVSDKKIQYYSIVKPNKVIAFDVNSKQFDYYPFLEDTVANEGKWYNIRTIDNMIYAMEVNPEDDSFSIFEIDHTGGKKLLIKSTLPKNKIPGDCWISDFYVIKNDHP